MGRIGLRGVWRGKEEEIWVILFSGMNWKNWVERGLERERGGVFTNIVKQLCF